MATNRLESIRARFQVHAPGSVPTQHRELDPLWHSRRWMTQIQERFVAITAPIGAISLDENTVRTKARSSAMTFMPSKPYNYWPRLFFSWSHFTTVLPRDWLKRYSVWDNGSGNRTRRVPAEHYVDMFPPVRSPLFRTLMRDDIPMQRIDSSALWLAMSGHLIKLSPLQLHAVFCEMKMLDIVRISLQCKWIAPALEAEKTRMDNVARGFWKLMAAINVPTGWERTHETHNRVQKKLPEHLRSVYVLPVSIADNAGHVDFHDTLTVTFYSNDLAGTSLSVFSVVVFPRQFGCVMGLRHFADKKFSSYASGVTGVHEACYREIHSHKRFSSYASGVTGVHEACYREIHSRTVFPYGQSSTSGTNINIAYQRSNYTATQRLPCLVFYRVSRSRRNEILLPKRAVGSGRCRYQETLLFKYA
ncbi:LOW QUALITY PROTEIN: hypothetical protein PHMEG_0006858 [Phytophthora megakarya]|uniref:Uncharacterized protein n=1 Tax=Phytophthora megakarya TaxID=4795 RepID=A0A225WQ27_9STRA|nr:LOW QUALITY PROTEIN: hypothetical protein PHMEG_0006858 [Phytophthora megakarya]